MPESFGKSKKAKALDRIQAMEKLQESQKQPAEKFQLHYCKNRQDRKYCEDVLGECSLRGRSSLWASTYQEPPGRPSSVPASNVKGIYGAAVVPMTWVEKARENATARYKVYAHCLCIGRTHAHTHALLHHY